MDSGGVSRMGRQEPVPFLVDGDTHTLRRRLDRGGVQHPDLRFFRSLGECRIVGTVPRHHGEDATTSVEAIRPHTGVLKGPAGIIPGSLGNFA